MPIGINNMTSVTLQNLTDITNVTTYPEFLINVNHIVWGGVFFFIMLWLFWIILFIAAQQVKNEILINAMYSGAIVSVLSFFARAIYVVQMGVVKGLLTDAQMWIFPIITLCLAGIIWATKRS